MSSSTPSSDVPEFDALLDSARREVVRPRASVLAAISALEPPAGARMLDAGCGPGGHLPLLLRAAGENGTVVGLDTDEAALAAATALHRDHSRIELVGKDAALQGVYGSDGTRTRDLRRDRPVMAPPG